VAKTNEEYWRDRALELEEKWHTKSQETIERELAAYYRQSLQHIQRDIEALYGTFAKDNQLSMTDAKKLLQGDEFRVWRMDIKEYLAQIDVTGDPALLKELNTLAMRSRITRLDKLYSETLMELSKLAKKTGQSMDKFLTEAYKDGYYRNLFEIGKKAGLVSTPVKVDNKQTENVLRTPWSGKNYSERIWRNDARLAETIKETVTQGIHRGSSLQKLSKQVADKMNVGINDAKRLVQTELNYVQNKSALDSIKEAGMGFYRVISTHDARTCQRCGDKDGEEISVGDASPGDTLPPFHARCRCTIAASFGDGKAQKGRRIARDKDGNNTHIPAAMNYKDWKAVCIDKTKTWTEWKKEVQEKENSGKIVFKAATTIAEANAFAMDVLGIPKASYKGCDFETANAWNEGLTDSFNCFPELKKNFGFVGEAHERNQIIKQGIEQYYKEQYRDMYPNESESTIELWVANAVKKDMRRFNVSTKTYAISHGNGGIENINKGLGGVVVNKAFGKNAKYFIESLKEDVKSRWHPTGCDTIRSVLDHEIGHQLDTLLGISKKQEIQNLINALGEEKITNNLSKYSWKNKNKNPHREFIAEAWAEYCNNSNPRPIAKKIGEIIEEEYKKQIGGGV